MAFSQSDITLTGHAIEARVYAEDPGRGFLPTGGRVVDLVEPSGSGVRVDSGLLAGTVVGSDYDPMLSKVIAHAPDRAGALRKLDRALGDTAVLGVVTNIEFARFLLADPDVIAGNLDTGLLDRRVEDFVAADASDEVLIAAAAYRWLSRWTTSESVDPWDVPSGWRVGTPAPTSIRLAAGTRTSHVAIVGVPADAKVEVEGSQPRAFSATLTGSELAVVIDGRRRTFVVAETDGGLWLAGGGTWHVREVAEVSVRGEDKHAGDAEIASPMPGAVIAVNVENGAAVSAGQPLVVVEAMKMEHSLTSPIDGIVEVLVRQGDQVMVDQVLARVVPAEEETAEVKTENTTQKEDA
ncbi:hypothetical protein GCM10020255_064290 [Rhodococcus baikonurensis]